MVLPLPIDIRLSRCCDNPLILGDASCLEIRQLLAASRLPASLLNPALSPLEAISASLQQQRANGQAVLSLHLVAHGEPGVVWVGDQAIDRAALLANAEVLANWGLKEIALWSCHVGADADFIALLEELTGASVLCSQGSIGASAGQVQRVVQYERHSLSECTGVSITEMFDGWPTLFKLGRSQNEARGINGQPFHLVREIPSLVLMMRTMCGR